MILSEAMEEAAGCLGAIACMAVVEEGPHADEFAVLDDEGKSYGYCPVESVGILYRWGTVVATVEMRDGSEVWSPTSAVVSGLLTLKGGSVA